VAPGKSCNGLFQISFLRTWGIAAGMPLPDPTFFDGAFAFFQDEEVLHNMHNSQNQVLGSLSLPNQSGDYLKRAWGRSTLLQILLAAWGLASCVSIVSGDFDKAAPQQ
jgi:hypothetical protein